MRNRLGWSVWRGQHLPVWEPPNAVFSTNSVIPVVGPVLDSVLLSLSSSSEGSIWMKARWNDNNKFITEICKQQQQEILHDGHAHQRVIRRLYNPIFSLIRSLYEVQSPYIYRYGKRHSIIQQPPNPTLFSGPIECRIREVSLYK